jgi:hypothetical protein
MGIFVFANLKTLPHCIRHAMQFWWLLDICRRLLALASIGRKYLG